MRCFRWFLFAGWLFFCCPCGFADPPPSLAETSVSLERLIQDYEAVERDLAKAREALKEAQTASQRRRTLAWIQELQRRQQELVDALEQKTGPLPPAVPDQPALPPEKRLDSQRIRDEAVLEKDVERRLRQ